MDQQLKVQSSSRGTLRFSRRGHKGSILLVALHRPHVKNAINDDCYLDLADLLHETAQDSSISALVLTGTGSYFSSGADLADQSLSVKSSSSSSSRGRNSLQRPVGRFMFQLLSYPKLLAAAVNGPAVGIGVTLLLHCDLVWCSETATFWTPFSRIALVPELCSSVTFLQRMGLAKANELLLLGNKIDATTALQWNLCSRIIPSSSSQGVSSDDPFHPPDQPLPSLAMHLVNEIDEKLLSLPFGHETAQLFVSMVRGRQQASMKSICQEELTQMDQRFDSGQVATAVAHLRGVRDDSNTHKKTNENYDDTNTQRPRSKL